MTCWVHTNPCAGPCDGLPIPSEDCLNCLDDNGYMGSTKFTPILAKSLMKAKNFVKAEVSEDDWVCDKECGDEMHEMEHFDWETCGDCMWYVCVEECENCDWNDENDPCWDVCLDCWDPAGCVGTSDWGEDEEWASEACAMKCWTKT